MKSARENWSVELGNEIYVRTTDNVSHNMPKFLSSITIHLSRGETIYSFLYSNNKPMRFSTFLIRILKSALGLN